VVASMPFQHFFLNYVKLSGMSGTLREVRTELACVYGVDVICLAPNRASQLDYLPAQVLPTTEAQLDALVFDVQHRLSLGRPVLVGTGTVEQSSSVSAALDSHQIAHNLLNASQDGDEASVISQAGIKGQVTVATNMAGRGTDIRLGSGVRECGGLHVIALAFNDSCRLDRQLAGRAGRQGDPGSFIKLLSLDDRSVVRETPQWLLNLVNKSLSRKRGGSISRNAMSDADNTASSSQIDFTPSGDRYQGAVRGISFAPRIGLLLLQWTQRRIQRRHVDERQRALNAAKQLSHHIAIGANTEYTQ